ncbi:MAG: hypothetical protein ACOX3U_00920 [Christensenellales bacterium]
MRKFRFALLILSIIYISLFILPRFALAEEKSYYIVTSDSATIYDSMGTDVIDDDKEFIVPKTYYLLHDGEPAASNNYYYVIYNGVKGRVSKSSVSALTTLDIEDPYYTATLKLNASELFLNTYSSPSSKSTVIFPINNYTDEMEYLGYMPDLEDGEVIWYYVRFLVGTEYKTGYVLATKTDNPGLVSNIPDHPSYESPSPSPSSSPSPSDNSPGEPSNNLLRVILILGISIPAVIVVFLLFKPAKRGGRNYRRPPRDYYDEYDDYEEDYYYDDYRDNKRDYRRRR